MSSLKIISAILFSTLFLGANCQKLSKETATEIAINNAAKEDLRDLECKDSSDCVAINADCCGCSQGGKQRAIAKIKAEETMAETSVRCGDTECIQALSNDLSCKQKASCVQNRCVLQ